MPSGFFDQFPAFFASGNTTQNLTGPRVESAIRARLNARYECLIAANADHIRNRTVLDVGSHDGRWSFAALHAGATHVTGIEPREDLVKAAAEHMRSASIGEDRYRFCVGDGLATLSQEDIRVQTVLLFGVYYHVDCHVALLRQLYETGAKTVIVDTQVSPESAWPGGHANAISFRTEKIDDLSNATSEIYPGAGVAIVGHPSRQAMQLLFTTFGFSITEIDWTGYLSRWGSEGLRDYADGERATFIAERSLTPTASMLIPHRSSLWRRRILGKLDGGWESVRRRRATT